MGSFIWNYLTWKFIARNTFGTNIHDLQWYSVARKWGGLTYSIRCLLAHRPSLRHHTRIHMHAPPPLSLSRYIYYRKALLPFLTWSTPNQSRGKQVLLHRPQFQLNKVEEKALVPRDTDLYLLYSRSWFTAMEMSLKKLMMKSHARRCQWISRASLREAVQSEYVWHCVYIDLVPVPCGVCVCDIQSSITFGDAKSTLTLGTYKKEKSYKSTFQ